MGIINVARSQFKSRISYLVKTLNEASDSYYSGVEIISNFEYDKLYDELVDLEKKTGLILENSPTQKVGSRSSLNSKLRLQKVHHEFPAKSLDKTKDIDKIVDTFMDANDSIRELVCMWKLDGSTVQLTYEGGKLVRAATRGDGYIGQDITHNASSINGIPMEIYDKGKYVIRGEALMKYSDFEKANYTSKENYKNPRNLASATITMLDPNEVKARNIQFKAFELVYSDDSDTVRDSQFVNKLEWMKQRGFGVVEYQWAFMDNKDLIKNFIEQWGYRVEMLDYPVDGLVLVLNDCNYVNQPDIFKDTEHHPHVYKGYALKWEDEVVRTIFTGIDWSGSRTGTVTPVATFEPIEIEGTTVSRASLHNISILKNFHLRIGDEIGVIKANKIIPQIVENYSDNKEYYSDDELNNIIPTCPDCGEICTVNKSEDSGIEVLKCCNPNCKTKLLQRLKHFCSRDGMNIEGLSEKTLEKFIDLGWLKEFSDIYKLDNHESEICSLDGFGETSYKNLIESISNSKNTTLDRVIVALGIPTIGKKQAKILAKEFNQAPGSFLDTGEIYYGLDWTDLDGFGDTTQKVLDNWFSDKKLQKECINLCEYLDIQKLDILSEYKLGHKVFVITGKLNNYSNRKELEKLIESNGGTVASSVSKNTDYLINNDIESESSKNKKAKQLGIQIITELEFASLLN